MKKLKLGLIAILMSLALVGCDQYVARNFGGNYTHELPKGEKLVNASFKEDSSIWYLTRPMREGEEAETYKFQADTVSGIFEGTVTIIESNE